ncbi:MAG TPA: hypothetical protein VJ801_06760, partial [Polyangia bacterium]|nr:hypothetical protein [Polyangia bacterium]
SGRWGVVLLVAAACWAPLAAAAQIVTRPVSPYPVLDDPRPTARPQAEPAPPLAPEPDTTLFPTPAAQVMVAPPSPSRFSAAATLAITYLSETNSSLTVATPVLRGLFRIRPHFLAELDWGFALMLDSDVSASARPGNPWLKGWYRGERGRLRWHAGVGVTAPLASVSIGPDGRIERALYNQSAAAWGLWDDWRWTPSRMAVPIPAALSYAFLPKLIATAEAALAPVVGVRDGESGAELLAQLALGARVLLPHDLWLCPRVQAVLLPAASVDRMQMAAGLRVEWTPRFGRFFAGVLVNLDEPLGVFGRGTQSWGIHLGKELDL